MEHHDEDDGHFNPGPHRPDARSLKVAGALAVLFLVTVLLFGLVPRLIGRAAERVERDTAAKELVRVVVTPAVPAERQGGVLLPASIQPLQETVVFARVNGYVRKYLVDIGDKVRAAQVLAEIDTPDTDQELHQAEALAMQARAAVTQAQTQRDLARITSNRYTTLAPSGVVSTQDLDERHAALETHTADVAAADASLGAAEANLRRLSEVKSFATVRAPFDGTITSRTLEQGQLVVAGTSNGQPLFKVAKTDIIRLFVNVPQVYAPAVHVDADVPVTVREFPGRIFPGHLTRTSHELDALSRTLLAEVRIPNPDGALLPGMYAQVKIDVLRGDTLVLAPSAAIFTNADGVRVAVVEEGVIHWRPITIDADLGNQVVVSVGVHAGDALVNMPSDRLLEGMHVRTDGGDKP